MTKERAGGDKLYLSNTDKLIFGVCGGIADRFSLDPTIVRLATVFLAFITGIFPLVFTYIVAWLIIPPKPLE